MDKTPFSLLKETPDDLLRGMNTDRPDVTESPFTLDAGHLPVPSSPGIGVDPLPEVLDEVTTSTEWLSI